MTKTYLHAGISHSDTSEEYMTALGIDADTRAAIMSQIDFEIAQDAVSAKKTTRCSRSCHQSNCKWQSFRWRRGRAGAHGESGGSS